MFTGHLYDLNPWLVSSVLLLAMMAASELGYFFGVRRATRFRHTTTRVDDATLGFLSLLLGFTFAAASARYDRRVVLMTNEATAIASLASTITMLDEPERSAILTDVRGYLDDRIEAPRHRNEDEARVALLRQTRAHQSAIHDSVGKLVRAQRTPTAHVALINGVNGILTTFEDAQDALTDHVPVTVFVMLVFAAIATSFSLGRIQGITSDKQPYMMMIYVSIVVLVVFVIFDLEQPRTGIVRVPTDALLRVRSILTH